MHTCYIVCGSPGAGKSTYAAKLARQLDATLLDIDTVTELLVQTSLRAAKHDVNDRDSSHFKETFREPIYETLFNIARENISFQNVVIVGPFTKEIRDKDWPSKVAQLLASSVEIHFVACEPQLRRQRLIARGNPRDKAKLDQWSEHTSYYGTEAAPDCQHVYVDGSKITENETISSLTITTLDHVALHVNDLDSARVFYEELVELRFSPTSNDLISKGIVWYDLPDGRQLHLFATADELPINRAHVALRVEDVSIWRERFEAAGVEIVEPLVSISQAERFFVRDPSANLIEFVKWL